VFKSELTNYISYCENAITKKKYLCQTSKINKIRSSINMIHLHLIFEFQVYQTKILRHRYTQNRTPRYFKLIILLMINLLSKSFDILIKRFFVIKYD